MSYQFNPFTGNLDLTGPTVSVLNVKGTVANAAALPGGATTGDVYQTEDTGEFYVWDGAAWDNLGTLVGPQGPTGPEGPAGTDGTDGVGVVAGGTTGQALVKASNTDYDTEWADVTAVAALDDLTDVTLTSPSDGQVLEYDSGTSTWVNATPSGGGGTPGGTTGQVQFNDGGSFAGDSGLTYDATTGALTVGGKTVSADAPVINLSQTWNNAAVTFTGLKLNVTNTASAGASNLLDLQVGGVSRFKVDHQSVITGSYFNAGNFAGAGAEYFGAPNFYAGNRVSVSSVGVVGWTSGAPNLANDLTLFRDAANTLAQRNGTNAQTYRLYNTYTDASNYERGFLRWSSNVFEIGSEGAGTGSEKPVRITAATLKLPNLPTYADNAAATSGGLVAGDVYKTATGELRITV